MTSDSGSAGPANLRQLWRAAKPTVGDCECPHGAKNYPYWCQVQKSGQYLLLSIESKNKQMSHQGTSLARRCAMVCALYSSLVATWDCCLKKTQSKGPEFKDSSWTTWLYTWLLCKPPPSTFGLPLHRPLRPIGSPQPTWEEGPGCIVLDCLQFCMPLVMFQGFLSPFRHPLRERSINISCSTLRKSWKIHCIRRLLLPKANLPGEEFFLAATHLDDNYKTMLPKRSTDVLKALRHSWWPSQTDISGESRKRTNGFTPFVTVWILGLKWDFCSGVCLMILPAQIHPSANLSSITI